MCFSSILANLFLNEFNGGGISDFKEDLTTEIALFHACEDVICTLEAAMFTSRLPKSQQKVERLLVDMNDLLGPSMLPDELNSSPDLKRSKSLPNLLDPERVRSYLTI